MELYEYARPHLMAGKKILFVHGFASSGQTGSVATLRLLLPGATVLAPDLPVEPSEAMELLRGLVASEHPDLIIGTSMGAMYSEMLYGTDRILVNPASWSISGKCLHIVSRMHLKTGTRSLASSESMTTLWTPSAFSGIIIRRQSALMVSII